MIRIYTVALTLLAAATCAIQPEVTAHADEANASGNSTSKPLVAKKPPSKPPVVRITSVAQPQPLPPLKYSLTPYYGDIQPGNAATSYYRAILLLPRGSKYVYEDKQADWAELPLDQFPKAEARKWLAPYANMLKEVRIATYREYCNWDLRTREMKGTEPLAMLLPELQHARAIVRVLRIRGRLEIAEGRFDDAIDTLMTGYTLAQRVAESRLLVGYLVGVACAGVMNQVVIDWIDAGGPNLYWALASLPNPLTDIRHAIEQEMYLPWQMFPFLKDPESASHTPAEWRNIIGESIARLASINRGDLDENRKLAAQAVGMGLILKGYTVAKKQLIESGMDLKKVDAMPVGQVVAIQTARACRNACQEATKWSLLPYAQGHQQMKETFARLSKAGTLGGSEQFPGGLLIYEMLLPGIGPSFLAPARIQREISALQTIEALRMYASDNNGRFPATLEVLRQSPAPVDAVTGKPFVYKVEQGCAVLTLPPPEGMNPERFGKRFELELTEEQ